MTEQEAQSKRDGDLVGELRLRTERPPVTRLSRRVLMGLAGVAGITISGALIWALYQGHNKPGGGPELYNTENKTTPDGLSTLPRDYAVDGQNGITDPVGMSGARLEVNTHIVTAGSSFTNSAGTLTPAAQHASTRTFG